MNVRLRGSVYACRLRRNLLDLLQITKMQEESIDGVDGRDDFNYGYNFEFSEKSIRLGKYKLS